MFDIAYAATASGTASGAGMGSTIMMIVLMIAIFYFLMIRPENKRKKQAEEMRSVDCKDLSGRIYKCVQNHSVRPWRQ